VSSRPATPVSRSGAAIAAVAAMVAVVVASNVLVQFPVDGTVGPLVLADLLTWGAFTYPVAFLVTDLTNRWLGPTIARRVVYVGFAVAVALSIYLATPRIAVASGVAFLVAQLLDIGVFNTLRRAAWWQAPLIASLLGSVVDTAIFFGTAFGPFGIIIGPDDPFAVEYAPLFGIFVTELPRWVSWALGDLAVKLAAAVLLLAPYRAAMALVFAPPYEPTRA
jgi:uncharacterized PurR-regulated membrane protein YhhQ (DUF165 family)